MSSFRSTDRRSFNGGLVVLAALAMSATAGVTTPALAQSGSSHTARQKVALQGYCPVCIIEMRKWVRGDSKHRVQYDGKTYYFPGEKQKQMFLADPAKYVPALGGDCTVCFAKMGKRVPGSIHHAAISHNRLFLFPSEDQKKAFLANPAAYADVDLALDGNCAVCLIEMNKEMPGKPEITAIYHGLRYQFPSEKQRKMFLANPRKYAVKPTASKQTSNAKPAANVVTVKGRSGCAGCDYGVVPIGAKDTLGLAVNTADGRVFVIEDAHKLYPDVYKNRFEGLPLKVSGKVLKRDGKITWIQPSQLEVLN